jgi:single-stranded-DNA-specific exonuclease
MNRRWLVNKTNADYIKYISKVSSVSPAVAQILINRGIKIPGEINSFLNPDISQLSDPFDIQGMRTAVERILDSSRKGEKVLVHGDYDVDGISATAIMLKALKMLGIESHYFIPNRMEHGYGFNPVSIKKAKQAGATLIITVDCGITSFETVELCKKEGIGVIITDHHEPLPLLPDALAVINPKISNPQSSISNLSGAGIAFKLAQALEQKGVKGSRGQVKNPRTLEFSDTSLLLLDLAALGTMADVVPLTGENRIIVKEGLNLIEEGVKPGLKALKKVSNIEGRKLSPGIMSFTIIPRINAAGRISDSNSVVKLLLTDSEDVAIEISLWVNTLNEERQKIEEEVYQEALYKLNNKRTGPVIVLSSEGWHQGVIGIVASRIAEAFCRPAYIISIEGNIAKGSARSVPFFDIYKSLDSCKEFLLKFGGHKQAAGFELESKNISSFEECMTRMAEGTVTEEDFIPSIEIDAEVTLSEVHFGLTRELRLLEPFGFGNAEPLLGSKGLEVLYPKIVKDNHLKMKLRQRSQSIEAIGFDMAEYFDILVNTESNSTESATVDAVFTPFVNEWEGTRYLQLNLKALRPSL